METDSGDQGTGWSLERKQSSEVREKYWGGAGELLENATCSRSPLCSFVFILLHSASSLGFGASPFVWATTTTAAVVSQQCLLSAAPCPSGTGSRSFLLARISCSGFQALHDGAGRTKDSRDADPGSFFCDSQMKGGRGGQAATERKAPRLIVFGSFALEKRQSRPPSWSVAASAITKEERNVPILFYLCPQTEGLLELRHLERPAAYSFESLWWPKSKIWWLCLKIRIKQIRPLSLFLKWLPFLKF